MNRIAIIDGEIDTSQLLISNQYVEKVYISSKNQSTEKDYTVNSSHATLIAQIIERFVPTCELVNFVVLQKSYRTSVEDLITALRQCIVYHVDIVSLSLGTIFPSDALQLYPVIKQMTQQGIIIVAAQSNNGEFTFPAAFCEVIGVKCDYKHILPPSVFHWNPNDPMNVEITVHCTFPDWKNDKIQIPDRNSFAVPFIVGQICNFPKEQRQSINAVRKSLQSRATTVSHNFYYKYKTSIEDRACRVALCLENNDNNYIYEILKHLNLYYKIQTLGISNSLRLVGACWIAVPEQESFTTQIQRIEDHSIAEIVLIVCTKSEFNTIPDDFSIDVILQSHNTGRMEWIIDRDYNNARHSGLLSPYEVSNAIQSILHGDNYIFNQDSMK